MGRPRCVLRKEQQLKRLFGIASAIACSAFDASSAAQCDVETHLPIENMTPIVIHVDKATACNFYIFHHLLYETHFTRVGVSTTASQLFFFGFSVAFLAVQGSTLEAYHAV